MATTPEANRSGYLKGISRIIAVATFAIACGASSVAAQNVNAVVNTINDYSSGEGSLTAVADGNLITVTGEVTGATAQLALNIPAGVTVRWQASFTGSTAFNVSFIDLIGTGTFDVAENGVIGTTMGTAIKNNSTGVINVSAGMIKTDNFAILNSSTGTVNISGGTVSSTTGNDVINDNNGTVNISGGTVENTGTGEAIYTTSGKINVSGGTVRAATGIAIVVANGAIGTGVIFVDNAAEVIANSDDNRFSVLGSNAVLIEKIGDTNEYGIFSSDELIIHGTGAIAEWVNQGGKPGIRYERGENSGFIEVAGVTVNKLDYTDTVSFPANATLTFGQTLAEAVLSGDGEGNGTFAFTVPTIAPTVAESGYFEMTFTPANADDYNTVTQNVSVAVNRATVAEPEPLSANLVYTGQAQTVELEESLLYILSDHTQTNAGNYNATIALSDKANYEWANGTTADLELPWSIAKADGEDASDYTAPATLTAKSDETLADVELPIGWKWDADPTTPVGEIGEKKHKATFTPANANYSTIASADWTITVTEATPILQPPYGRDLSRSSPPLYYTLKGTPLGTTKPTAPGVYIEKHSKHVRKIAVR